MKKIKNNENKTKGILKSKEMFKIAIVSTMVISALTMMSSFIALGVTSIGLARKFDSYVKDSEPYKEYVQVETASLNERFEKGEISENAYDNRKDELKDTTKFVESIAAEEDKKAYMEKYNEMGGKTVNALLTVAGASAIVTASAAVTKIVRDSKEREEAFDEFLSNLIG